MIQNYEKFSRWNENLTKSTHFQLSYLFNNG
jgi:hypothetical protein